MPKRTAPIEHQWVREPIEETHWTGCWRDHHKCAISIIEQIVDGAVDDAIRRLLGAHIDGSSATNEGGTASECPPAPSP